VENPDGGVQSSVQTNPKVSLEAMVYNLRSGNTRQVSAFEPTNSFSQVFPFIDQYQRSGTIWSADSKNLVLAAVDQSGGPSILVMDVERGQSQKIANGEPAFWSWK
jgi:Tol biopolymer transport system component